MAEILRYEHVDISYGAKVVVKDVNVSIKKGEILGIVGESGSGKSTLIKAAMGLLGKNGIVSRGDIWYYPEADEAKDYKSATKSQSALTNVNESAAKSQSSLPNRNDSRNAAPQAAGRSIPLCDLSEREMRKVCGPEIGMIFQMAGASFSPIRTVRKQLYEFMNEHGRIDKKDFEKQASEMLSNFGFDDPKRILDSYPFELSGGMQQRVGIAAAMLMNPKILMADEPTSALDVSVQKQVVEMMKMVREKFGTTILLVTHNIGVVRAMADNVLVLKSGVVQEYGKAAEVLDHPCSEYTKKLMSAVPKLRR